MKVSDVKAVNTTRQRMEWDFDGTGWKITGYESILAHGLDSRVLDPTFEFVDGERVERTWST